MRDLRPILILGGLLAFFASRVDIPWVSPFTPAPIPGSGLSVLIMDERDDYDTEAYKPYLDVLTSEAIPAYLDEHCAKVDGQPEWRHWDEEVEIVEESQKWKDALALPRSSLPWIIVSNGRTGYSGPLPQSEEAALELIKQYE